MERPPPDLLKVHLGKVHGARVGPVGDGLENAGDARRGGHGLLEGVDEGAEEEGVDDGADGLVEDELDDGVAHRELGRWWLLIGLLGMRRWRMSRERLLQVLLPASPSAYHRDMVHGACELVP